MSPESLRMVGPATVQRALSCGRTAARALMARLGGSRVPGLGWRVSERKLIEYIRKLEKGDRPWTRNSRSSHAEPTGTATCEPQPASESSELCTSETTAAENPSEQPLPPTGKSNHVQRLELLISQSAQSSRSAKRSARSPHSKRSPA